MAVPLLLLLSVTAPPQLDVPDESRVYEHWQGHRLPARSSYSHIDPSDAVFAGDLDADGQPDVVYVEEGPEPWLGAITALSGAGLDAIWRVRVHILQSPYSPSPSTSIAQCDDLDGDGTRDLLVGLPYARPARQAPGTNYPNGMAYVLSGRTGAILRTHQGWHQGQEFAASVADLGDVDGDGVGDYLCTSGGNWSTSSNGDVTAFSGATGAMLYTLRPQEPPRRLGEIVQVTDDVDGDGARDFLLSEPEYNRPGTGAARLGRIWLCSGADGSLIRRWSGQPTERIGWSLCLVGDQDGDGIRDFATALQDYSLWSDRIAIYSTAGGQRIRTLVATRRDRYGHQLVGISDVSGDGLDDLLVADPTAYLQPFPVLQRGAVRVLDSVTGETLSVWSTLYQSNWPDVGRFLGSGSWLRDGALLAVLVPFPEEDGIRYSIMKWKPGIRLTPSQVSLSAGPTPVDIAIDLHDLEAGHDYLVLMSTRTAPSTSFLGAPTPLGPSPLLSRYLLGLGSGWMTGMRGTLDAHGRAQAALLIPASPAFAGRSIHFCVLSHDGLVGRDTSAAATLELTP